jgi:hypothetical protein
MWHYYTKMTITKLNISQPSLCGSTLAVPHRLPYTTYTYTESEMYSYRKIMVLQILTCYLFLTVR